MGHVTAGFKRVPMAKMIPSSRKKCLFRQLFFINTHSVCIKALKLEVSTQLPAPELVPRCGIGRFSTQYRASLILQ